MHMIIKTACVAGLMSVLGGCGGGPALSENERKYADQCAVYTKKSACECTARIFVPKLSQAELNSFINMPKELLGKPLTDELTRPHGFTVADNMSFFQKFSEVKPEVDRQCGS